MPIPVNKEVFLLLHNQIRKKSREKYKVITLSKGAALYGFGKHNEREHHTIKSAVLRNEDIEQYIIDTYNIKREKKEKVWRYFNGKYLYDRMRDYEKGVNPIFLSGIYETVLFKFLDCEDIIEFIEKYPVSEGSKKIQRAILNSTDAELSDLKVKYKAFYYNYNEDTVRNFNFEVDYINNYKAKQWGFHYTENISYSDSEQTSIFIGKGIKQKQCLYFNLKPKEEKGDGGFMSLTLYVGGMAIQKMDLIKGALTTISARGYITSNEIFLMKLPEGQDDFDDKNEAHQLDILRIKQYLVFEKRTFRIPTRTKQETSQIKAKRFSLDSIKHMIGSWRLWSFTRTGLIYQSKFVINEDYTAYLETANFYEGQKQVCLLYLSQVGRSGINLVVTAHEEVGTQIQNFAIIEVPVKKTKILDKGSEDFKKESEKSFSDKKDWISVGTFCGLGVNDERYSLGCIALLKESEEIEFHSKTLYHQNIGKLFNSGRGQERYTTLYKTLIEIEKKHKRIHNPKTKNWLRYFSTLKSIEDGEDENYENE